ncbi:hypothetical protein ABTY20_27105 [Streptomyces sp. NPDC126497]|uniref:hypothetical protein n=1 Tax=Streptomyces sp. NPDC126497 TaxID=3155313 RepID=UPI00332D6B54
MVTALAAAVLSVSAASALLLALLIAVRGGKSTTRMIKLLFTLLPEELDAFLGRVGERLVALWRAGREGRRDGGRPAPRHRDTRVGIRLRLIGAFYPADEKWRLEEAMNHRNEVRRDAGAPRFSYLAAFAGACRMRWEAWTDPKRQVD